MPESEFNVLKKGDTLLLKNDPPPPTILGRKKPGVLVVGGDFCSYITASIYFLYKALNNKRKRVREMMICTIPYFLVF